MYYAFNFSVKIWSETERALYLGKHSICHSLNFLYAIITDNIPSLVNLKQCFEFM
jgi:hypothetical protein